MSISAMLYRSAEECGDGRRDDDQVPQNSPHRHESSASGGNKPAQGGPRTGRECLGEYCQYFSGPGPDGMYCHNSTMNLSILRRSLSTTSSKCVSTVSM